MLAERGGDSSAVDRWRTLDENRRKLLVQLEDLKRQRNESSKMIGQLKKAGEDAASAIAQVGTIKGEIEEGQNALNQMEDELKPLAEGIPNLFHESVPLGPDESFNREEKRVGTPKTFSFEPQAHWDLGTQLGILDFDRGAKVAGARFTTYFGLGARLERALIQFMLDFHTDRHGYTEVLPPFIVNAQSLFGTGQLPKFEADLFKLQDTGYYLIPTAEVPVTNLHRDEILEEADLPIRYTAYTPCFRSEAGSHGRDVRGLIRQHQFNKVELVHFVHPDQSYEALESLTGHAEAILEALDLPYRRVTLASGDLSFSSAKTYDLEVWLPGADTYREISSCSNFEDFQARRANIRYRPQGGGKARLAHTLNGSGLAVGRTLVAILENGQEEDGSVTLPEVLRPYMGGRKSIG